MLLLLSDEILTFSQTLNFQLLACCTFPNIPDVVCGCLEVTCGVVTTRNVYVVLLSAFDWFVHRNRWAHEAFFYLTKSFETRPQLEVMIGITFGNGADNGDVVTLGADIVCGRHNGNIDVCSEGLVKK